MPKITKNQKARAKEVEEATGIENDKHAEFAEEALRAFSKKVYGTKWPGEEPTIMVSDLVSDLMHWCVRNGADWDEAIENANANYLYEAGLIDEQGNPIR